MAVKKLDPGITDPRQLHRRFGNATVSLTHVLATTDVVDLRSWGSAMVSVPSTSTINEDVGVHVSESPAGEYSELRDSTGTALTVKLTTSKAVALPDQAFAAGYVKLVTASADVPVVVMGKS